MDEPLWRDSELEWPEEVGLHGAAAAAGYSQKPRLGQLKCELGW